MTKLVDILPAEPQQPTARQLRAVSGWAVRKFANLDPQDVESIVGEAWFDAMHTPSKTGAPFGATVLTFTRNRLMTAAKRQQRHARMTDTDADLTLLADATVSRSDGQVDMLADLRRTTHGSTEPVCVGVDTYYSRRDVPAIVGISYRRLDHWERVGVVRSDIPPAGSGRRAVMSQRTINGVALVARMVKTAHVLDLPPWPQVSAVANKCDRVAWVPGADTFGRNGEDTWVELDVAAIRQAVTKAVRQ